MASIHLPLRELELAQKMVDSADSAIGAQEPRRRFKQDLLDIIAGTDEIFAGVDHPDTQLLSSGESLNVADRLQQLVAKYDVLLPNLRPTNPGQSRIHGILESQRERLDSLAETFRMGADPAFCAHAHMLIEQADRSARSEPRTNWRDLVGSLHD